MFRSKIKSIIFHITFSIYENVLMGLWLLFKKRFHITCIDTLMFKDKSVLIVSPHSDDETLGCGGLLQHLKDSEVKIKYLLLSENWDDINLSNTRLNELHSSLSLISSRDNSLVSLGYQDGSLFESLDDIEHDIRNIIVENSIDYIFVTSIFDFHPDHRAASEIALKLTKYNFVDNVIMYHTNHPINLNLPIHYYHLTKDEINLKKKALACFKSQYLFDFTSFSKISSLYSKTMHRCDGAVEPFIVVNKDNVDNIRTAYNRNKLFIENNEYSRSIMHPYKSISNMLTWLRRS